MQIASFGVLARRSNAQIQSKVSGDIISAAIALLVSHKYFHSDASR
jgi:hypothetical protein